MILINEIFSHKNVSFNFFSLILFSRAKKKKRKDPPYIFGTMDLEDVNEDEIFLKKFQSFYKNLSEGRKREFRQFLDHYF